MYSAAITAFLMSLFPVNFNADLCGTHITTAPDFIRDLTSRTGSKVLEATTAQVVAISDDAHKQVWVMLKLPNNHPVVVCRTVVQRADGRFYIDSALLCDGSATECSQLASRFR